MHFILQSMHHWSVPMMTLWMDAMHDTYHMHHNQALHQLGHRIHTGMRRCTITIEHIVIYQQNINWQWLQTNQQTTTVLTLYYMNYFTILASKCTRPGGWVLLANKNRVFRLFFKRFCQVFIPSMKQVNFSGWRIECRICTDSCLTLYCMNYFTILASKCTRLGSRVMQ